MRVFLVLMVLAVLTTPASADGSGGSATCGNGQLDTGERCDIAIGSGVSNACPTQSECTALPSPAY